MAGTYRPRGDVFGHEEHTADVWLVSEGCSGEEVLSNMLEGLYGTMGREYTLEGSEEEFGMDISGGSLENLMIDLLTEALFLFEVGPRLIVDPSIHLWKEGKKDRLEVSGRSVVFSIPEGQGGMEVKAITYHGASFIEERGSFRARVLLDI